MADWEENDTSAFGGHAANNPGSPFGSRMIDSDAGFGGFGSNTDSNTSFGFGTPNADGFGFGQSDRSGNDRRGGRGRGRGRGRGGGGRGGGSSTCYKCHKEGHMARECPNSESGGDGGASPFGGFGGGGGFGNDSERPKKGCFKCGDEGHISRDCPQGGGVRDGKRTCHKCGEEGHMASACSKEGGDDERPRPPIYIPAEIEDEDLVDLGIAAGINFDNYENIPVKVSGEGLITDPVSTFEEMEVRKILTDNIKKAGYKSPTPIQKYAVPILMGGRDIMACAQTGSGKTVAFLLPILHYILQENCISHAYEETVQPVALIICPTRELAIQIYYEARKLARGSLVLCRLAYGGASSAVQLKKMQVGCHLLVGTVGRIVDYMQKDKLHFNELKFLVLDEADRMLEMGFLVELKKIFGHPTMPPLAKKQMLMFSATFPAEVQNLAATFMENYVFVVVGTIGAANTDVTQEVVEVEKTSKKDLLLVYVRDILDNDDKAKILVFVEQKKMADFIGSYLCNNDMKATTIHGDRFQMQREEALETFRNGTYNVLVATAVAARGLDIKGVRCVINFDLPREIDEYVHRIGRTGRVGNTGYAVSFFDKINDAPLAKHLAKILSEADQEVPDWLKESAKGSGPAQGYYGSGSYASSDVRKLSNRGKNQNWEGGAIGGPTPYAPSGGLAAVDDDDEWDA